MSRCWGRGRGRREEFTTNHSSTWLLMNEITNGMSAMSVRNVCNGMEEGVGAKFEKARRETGKVVECGIRVGGWIKDKGFIKLIVRRLRMVEMELLISLA